MPYGEEDAPYFFGRDQGRDIVLDNVLAYRVSILLGPSGVGKSSLLRAGVGRHVRDEGRRRITEDEPAEHVAVVFSAWPDDPVAGLVAAIADALAALSPALAADLPTGSLADVASEAARRVDGSMLVILDQFEEYFLYHPAGGRFEDELLALMARRDAATRLLISIREDALAKLDAFAGRLPGLLDHLVRIGDLDRVEARAAVVAPLAIWSAAVGEEIRIEPELVEAVLDGVVRQHEGRLAPEPTTAIQAPYLQLVMTRLWEEERARGSSVLTCATLRRLGGAGRIVATHVDTVMCRLSERDQSIAAVLLGQLVTPTGTKVALREDDLVAYARAADPRLADAAVTAVLERLTRGARILRASGDARYELHHDALAQPIVEWRRHWRERRDRDARHRRNRLVAMIVAALALTVVGVATLALLAVHGRRDARREAADTRAVAIAIAARDQRAQPDVALLLALAGLRGRDLPETRSSMLAARAAAAPGNATAIMRGHDDVVVGVASLAGGGRIVSAGADGRVLVWDARTHRQLGPPFSGPPTRYTALAVSPDETTLAAAAAAGAIRVWNISTRRIVGVLPGEHELDSIAFAPDANVLAAAGAARKIELWDVAGRRVRRALASPDEETFRIALSPDGRMLAAAGSNHVVRLWDVRSGRPLRERLRRGLAMFSSVAFAPDGRLAASGRETWLWDLRNGAARRLRGGPGKGIRDLAFDPKGVRLAGAGGDGSAWLWDVRNRRGFARSLSGPTRRLDDVSFSSDGRTLVVGGHDARVWLFDAVRSPVLAGHAAPVVDIAFAPSGTTLATAGADGRVVRWDTVSARAIEPPLAATGELGSIAFDPRGIIVAAGGADGLIELWNTRTNAVVGRLRGAGGRGSLVTSLAFAEGGRLLASGALDGTVAVWDVLARRRVGAVLRGRAGEFNPVAVDSSGRLLAYGRPDGTIVVLDIRSRAPIGPPLPGHRDGTNDLAFGPGSLLVSGGEDRRIRFTDVRSRRSTALRHGDAAVRAVAVTPDGRTAIGADYAGVVRLWDIAARRRSGSPLVEQRVPVNALAVAPDGATIAVASSDATARLWPRVLWRSARGDLTTEICALVGADLSGAEWSRYAPGLARRRLCDR